MFIKFNKRLSVDFLKTLLSKNKLHSISMLPGTNGKRLGNINGTNYKETLIPIKTN
ncbi:hypothetical protein J2Y40_001072 [Chryseobacterium sp. 2987]|nr:hypothetical protein [Chryseobacterium sp. 2987]